MLSWQSSTAHRGCKNTFSNWGWGDYDYIFILWVNCSFNTIAIRCRDTAVTEVQQVQWALDIFYRQQTKETINLSSMNEHKDSTHRETNSTTAAVIGLIHRPMILVNTHQILSEARSLQQFNSKTRMTLSSAHTSTKPQHSPLLYSLIGTNHQNTPDP